MKSCEHPSQPSFLLINSQELNSFVSSSAKDSATLKDLTASRSKKSFGLAQLGQFLLNFVIGNSEPRVYQKHDRHGNPYFQVYDPVTCAFHSFGSEQELRVWFDERYYQ